MTSALGMIECGNLPAALEAADVMLKSSRITLVGFEKTGAGLTTVLIYGQTEHVQKVIERGVQAAENVGEVASLNVIPSPHPDLLRAPGLDIRQLSTENTHGAT